MDKREIDEAARMCATYFAQRMDIGGWLGIALQERGYDINEISSEEVQKILLRTIIQLYDAWEGEIELELERDTENEDDATQEEKNQAEEMEEEEREEVESEQKKEESEKDEE